MGSDPFMTAIEAKTQTFLASTTVSRGSPLNQRSEYAACGIKVAVSIFRKCWFCRSGDNVESPQHRHPAKDLKKRTQVIVEPLFNSCETFQSFNTRN